MKYLVETINIITKEKLTIEATERGLEDIKNDRRFIILQVDILEGI